MSFHDRSPGVLLAALGLCSTLAAHAADGMPPPGLYRVDSNASFETARGPLPSAKVQLQSDGSTGNTRYQGTVTGEAPVSRQIPGQGPATVCIAERNAANILPPAAAGACVGSKGVPGAQGGTTFISHCSFADITTTIRQVDARTWEYASHTVLKAPAKGGGAPSGMLLAVMENQAKNAPTAQERADAAAALEELRGQGSPAAVGAGATTPAAQVDSVITLTRLAPGCGAVKPH